MNPLLLAAIHAVQAFGAEISDVRRLDLQGSYTTIGVIWPGTTNIEHYSEDFGPEAELRLAGDILRELVYRL